MAAIERQWERTIARRTYLTGGMGSRHADRWRCGCRSATRGRAGGGDRRRVVAVGRARPAWAGEAVLVDRGRRLPVRAGYAEVEATWRAGDEVRLELPMRPRWTRPDPHVDGSVARVMRSDVKHCLRAHCNRRTAEIVQHRERVLPTREDLVQFVHHCLDIPLHVDRSSVDARDATRGHAATLPAAAVQRQSAAQDRGSRRSFERGSEQRICTTIARACMP